MQHIFIGAYIHMEKTPRIISLLNQKGGSGKTTLAINIAHGLQLRGKKVLIADADSQRSAIDWKCANPIEPLVPVQQMDRETIEYDIKAVSGGYDYIIIDSSPRVELLSSYIIKASDFVIIPLQASPLDVKATNKLIRLIRERKAIADNKPLAAFIITMVKNKTKLSDKLKGNLALDEWPSFQNCTHNFEIYKQSMEEGQTVFCFGKNKASKEMNLIIDELETFV